jgi:hypothetical protein
MFKDVSKRAMTLTKILVIVGIACVVLSSLFVFGSAIIAGVGLMNYNAGSGLIAILIGLISLVIAAVVGSALCLLCGWLIYIFVENNFLLHRIAEAQGVGDVSDFNKTANASVQETFSTVIPQPQPQQQYVPVAAPPQAYPPATPEPQNPESPVPPVQ